MLWKVISVAVFAAITGFAVANAQTIAQIGDPAELPPAGYKGDQYVDSRGCVFMRISNGGQMQWYPRVNGAHKVVCGFPPTYGAKPAIEMADETPVAPAKPAPVAVAAAAPTKPAATKAPAQVATAAPAKPAPVAAAKPAQVAAAKPAPAVKPAPVVTVAAKPAAVAPAVVPVAVAQQPAPYTAAPPARYQVATSADIPPGKIGCFTTAPVAEVVRLRNGGTVVVCTRGDGTATGWRAPVYPANAPVGAALRNPVTTRAVAAPAPVAVAAVAPRAPVAKVVPAAAPVPTYTVPKGYKLAWKDGRLNPLRGQGTAEGWAQQDRVWTHTTPAQLISDQPKTKAKAAPVYATQVSVSSMNAPKAPVAQKSAKPAASGALWVQIGSFGVPANAQGAADRLAALGLSVGKSKITKGGKTLQIVLAGPFGSSADAQTALRMAQQAGFGDAFVR